MIQAILVKIWMNRQLNDLSKNLTLVLKAIAIVENGPS